MTARAANIDCQPTLGYGVYTIPDTSRILNLPGNRLRRWISGYWKISDSERCSVSPPLIEGGVWSVRGSRALNFYALIEIYTFMALRGLGIPLQRIRRARSELSEKFNTVYPFASHELLCDGKQIIVVLKEVSVPILMFLGENGQAALNDIVEPFCHRIDFSGHTRLARKYWPLGKSRAVVVDPQRGFGRPTIKDTNITTEGIAGLVRAGENPSEVAELYDIGILSINDAIEFELQNAA